MLFTADGRPKLADFGLARVGTGPSDATLSQMVLGTPSYLAPEAALGRAADVTAAADIYGLGAVGYQWLTSRPPFLGATPFDTLIMVREQEPAAPRGLRRDLPLDLQTIVLKCLEKDPARRYRDAESLGADLRSFVAGRAISARPVGPLRGLAKSARRHPAVAALSAALVVGLVIFAGLWRRAEAAQARAESEQAKADRRLALASEALEAFKNSAEARSLLPDGRAREDRATLVKLAGWLTRNHDDFPGDLVEQHRAAYGLLQVAKTLARLSEDALAAEYADAALAYLRAVVAADPADRDYRSSLSEACVQRVGHRTALGRHEGNLESLREAVGLAAGLAQEFPASDHSAGRTRPSTPAWARSTSASAGRPRRSAR